MSTRSAIICQTPTGYAGIYCHSDGYPSWTGHILATCFNTRETASALVALGDLSGISKEGDTDPYSSPGTKGWDDCCPIEAPTAEEVAAEIGHDNHVYVFSAGQLTHNGTPLREVLAQPDIAAEIARFFPSEDEPTTPPMILEFTPA